MMLRGKKHWKWIFTAIVSCICLSIGAQCFPVDIIKKNLQASVASFSEEASYPEIIRHYKGGQLDDCTDALILNIAGYDGNESVLIRAMANYRTTTGNDPCADLRSFQKKNGEVSVKEYTRYWFGNLFFIKLMLLFFDYSDMQMWNQMIQIGLLVYVIYLFIKRKMEKFCIPLLLSVFLLMPVIIPLSLQFSSVYYITLITMILIIHSSGTFIEKMQGGGYLAIFACVGIITNWLDLLTYPLLTLGMPLVLILLIAGEKGEEVRVDTIMKLSIAWGAGYGGMWILKWALASVILGRNVFKEAFYQITFRVSQEYNGNYITRPGVVKRNLGVIENFPYLTICIAAFIYGIIRILNVIRKKRVKIKFFRKTAISYIFIASMPFIWYGVLVQHSWMHVWFTYRNLAISDFSIFTLLYQFDSYCMVASLNEVRDENISSHTRKGGFQRNSQ